MFCFSCGHKLPHELPATCSKCETTNWLDAKPTASALTTYDGKLMLVKRTIEPYVDYWDIPGGFCQPHEHPIDAAKRELLEETGLHIQVTGFFGIWLDDYKRRRYPPQLTFNVYYHAKALDDPHQAKPDLQEISEIGWFAPDNLPEPIAFPKQTKLLLPAWCKVFLAGETTSPLIDYPKKQPLKNS